MKRSHRAVLAQETLEICESGEYRSATGRTVSIAADLESSKAGTLLYSPDNIPDIGRNGASQGIVEVSNESTIEALTRLSKQPACHHLACLNFASAKNAGGGFLRGSQAQEESLARSSTLYPALLTQPDYYSRNRANSSCLYLDLIIYSPSVIFFRNDEGTLVDQPVKASVITAPAPNAGAIGDKDPSELDLVEETLLRRGKLVLGIAAAHRVTHLILGAWGCGVFRNDPTTVAKCFARLLTLPDFAGRFDLVLFAIFDPLPQKRTYQAFANILNDRGDSSLGI